MPAPLDEPPYFCSKTTVFCVSRFLGSLPLGDHYNSRFMPDATKRQLSSEDLDDQHCKREYISLFSTRRLSISLLAWWVDKFRGQPS